MADFTERLTLLITVDPSGAVGVLKGFGDTAKTELTKVEGVANTAGTRAGNEFGTQFNQSASTALAAISAAVAGFGAAKVIGFGKDAVADAVEYQRAVAQLDAALAGVGADAGVTKSGIDHLSDSIQNQDAIFKGDVKSAASLLLALGDIKNQAGEGNDVFNRTLTLSAAIANVFNKDIGSTVNQLGRALENPARGLQALSRSGVPLSQETFTQVQALSKRGDLLGAQKVLLDDLEKRYLALGEAAAKADPLQQLSVATKEFKTQVGGDILPGVTVLLNATESLFSGFSHLPQPIRGTAEALIAVAAIAIPLQKVREVMASINTIASQNVAVQGGGAAASQTEVAAATGAQGKAAQDAAANTAPLNAELQSLGTSGAAAVEGLTSTDGALVGLSTTAGSIEAELASVEAVLVSLGVAPEAAAAAVANLSAQLTALQPPLAGTAETSAVVDTELAALQARLAALGASPLEVAAAFDSLDASLLSVGEISGAGLGELEVILASLGVDADTLALALANVDRELILVNGTAIEFATTEELVAERARLLALNEDEAAVASRGLGASLGTIAGGAGALLLVGGIVDNLGKKAPDVDRLTQSIHDFSKSGDTTGALKQALNDINLEALQRGSIENTGTFSLPGIHQATEIGMAALGKQGEINTAKEAVKNLDAAMAQLVGSGDINEANKLFQQYGVTIEQAGGKFPQFFQALDDYTAQQQAANGASQDAISVLNGEAAAFADLQTKFDLTSALDSVHSAVQQVKEDRADIAGTSQKAKDADRSEADAKHSLADATRGVGDAQQRLADSYLKVGDAQEKVGDANLKLADAQHSLAEAQAELNLFNSPRGQQERAFERDIIVRRVVTTPEGEEQKQLDLLRNQDDTAKKQQDLADRVHSAQEGVASATRGVRDALRGVADAQRAVITAEHGVEDATFRVRDAQDRVSQATEARKKVSEDASQRIAGDIDKEQKALLNVVTVLENAAAKGEVGNDTVRHWIGLLKQAADAMNGPVSQAVDSLALKTHNLGAQGGVGQVALPPNIPISAADRGRLTYESQPGFQGPISAQDRATLHSLGIPGFATGGEVPGALGAPMLALVHGGERVLTPAQQRSLPKPPPSGQSIVVHQENNFHGDVPSTADLEYANRALGWRLSQTGRNG